MVNKSGCFEYEQYHAAQILEDDFGAWGCGSDFAIMAMRLGKSADEAVLLASEFSVECGMGVDYFIYRHRS